MIKDTNNQTNQNSNVLYSKIIIPAYTSAKKGIYLTLDLQLKKSDNLKIITDGKIAQSLENLLFRNIEILAGLKSSFASLLNFEYTLTSKNDNFYSVKDVRSASLPICLGLLNLLRAITGKKQIHSIAGTGILRADGSFEESAFEQIKETAINNDFAENITFIKSSDCKHIFDLENLLNNF